MFVRALAGVIITPHERSIARYLRCIASLSNNSAPVTSDEGVSNPRSVNCVRDSGSGTGEEKYSEADKNSGKPAATVDISCRKNLAPPALVAKVSAAEAGP